MRTLLVLSLLAGCGFEHGRLSGTTSDGGGGDADADTTGGHWMYRKPISILGAQVRNGPHARFVALIMWDIDDALTKHAANDGHDIRFFAGDGTTPLPYERVSYDAATGALQAWVQVPSIQQSMDTLIYMEYGNAGAVEQQNRAATWPPNVIGVWHLEDGTDSTGNANDAQTVNGVVIGGKGKVGRAATFDGVDDRLLMPDSPSLDSVATQATISTWINFKDATGPTRQFIMASSNDITPPKSAFEWATGTNGDNYFYPRRGDGDLAFN